MRTLLFTISALLAGLTARAEILVKSGEKIAFLGDSITQRGWEQPQGYVRLVMQGLTANGVKATAIPAGVSGNSSVELLMRVEPDVIEKKPDWMILSCGVNDILFGKDGVPLNDRMAAYYRFPPEKSTFQKNITALLDQVEKAGIKPVILTITTVKEDQNTAENKRVVFYNDFLRKIAAERKLPLADVSKPFHERLESEGTAKGYILTVDGVHLNAAGNRLMATAVLSALGADAAERKKAQAAWPEPPPAKPAAPAKPAGKPPKKK